MLESVICCRQDMKTDNSVAFNISGDIWSFQLEFIQGPATLIVFHCIYM